MKAPALLMLLVLILAACVPGSPTAAKTSTPGPGPSAPPLATGPGASPARSTAPPGGTIDAPPPARTGTPDPDYFMLDYWIMPAGTRIYAVNLFDLDQAQNLYVETNMGNGRTLSFDCRTSTRWAPIGDLMIGQNDDHYGLDLFVKKGTPIYAPVSGSVRVDPGTRVRLYPGELNEVHYTLAHMTPLPDLVDGLRVSAGQLLGRAGLEGEHQASPPVNIGGEPDIYEVHFDIRHIGEDGRLYFYDPLWGKCSNTIANPWGHTVIPQWDTVNPLPR